MRTIVAITLACCASACASAPPVPAAAPVVAPGPTFEQKISWILRLEDQRALRDPAPAVQAVETPPVPAAPARGRNPAPPPAPVVVPPPTPDLVRLLGDSEARVRRRAALAIGHVGLPDGVTPLVDALKDPEPEVRQMAAFALGLIGDKRALDPLAAALGDPSPLVKGSAAEALGLIGDATAADAVAKLAASILDGGGLAQTPGEDEDVRRDTPASAYRLAVYALVRLKSYPALASAVLDSTGQPRVTWWPVAYALQRIEDARAYAALATLAKDSHPYTRAFAVKGLGGLKNRDAVPIVLPLVTGPDRGVAIEAIRALGKIGGPAGAPALLTLVQAPKPDPVLRLEAITALGTIGGEGTVDTLLDALSDPSPLIRAAATASLAQVDRDNFVTTLSALDPDPEWKVRASLAAVLATLPPEMGLPRLHALLGDPDQRVKPYVLDALVKLKAPDAAAIALEHLKADDPIVRAAAADALGELKYLGGTASLAEAYRAGQRDPEYNARASAIEALAHVDPAGAKELLTTALADKDWAVRVKAASLLKDIDRATDAETRIRPAATMKPDDYYASPRLGIPPVSTSVYIDTDRGTIQIELAVLDAPVTVDAFVTLARKNFFDGLTFHRVVPDFVIQGGDPRGDGSGGPGFTLRDELNERAFVRGTVGMALDWPGTGGSQFFITHSPQPHLDARYTAFGRVVAGMDVVDAIQQGDVIRHVRVWDGELP